MAGLAHASPDLRRVRRHPRGGHPARPDPTPRWRRRAGARERPVPQRLARLDGPRQRHRDLPARSRPRARRGRRLGRGRRGCRVAGSRRHRTLRLRLRCVPRVRRGRGPGLPQPAPARVHRPRLVRRARRRARRADQPRRAARGTRPGHGGGPRLPRRHGVPGRGRSRRTCWEARAWSSSAPAAWGSRQWPWPAAEVRGSARSTSPQHRSTGRWTRVPTRSSTPRSAPTRSSRPWRTGRAGAPTSASTRSGPPRPAAPASCPWPVGGGTSRWACCPPQRVAPTSRWSASSAWELDVLGSHGMAAADYPALLDDVASRRLDLRGLLAPGEPLGLEDAGAALVAMASTPSRGIVLVDPTR